MQQEGFMRLGAIAAFFAILSSIVSLPADAVPAGVQPGIYADATLALAVRSANRTPENMARDRYRHPRESLSFWGLRPGMTVLEIWPGGGYWTDILAPYAKATSGKYIAAVPSASSALPAKFADKSEYGDIQTTVFNEKSPPMVPPG